MIVSSYLPLNELFLNRSFKGVKCVKCKIDNKRIESLCITNLFREICSNLTRKQIHKVIHNYKIVNKHSLDTVTRINFTDKNANHMSMNRTTSLNFLKELTKLSTASTGKNTPVKLYIKLKLENNTILRYKNYN